jgi:signal transduction histidine kinase
MQPESHYETSYKIRPAGRHILTVGRDLIQDRYAALVELVKNAYDADSPTVDINFSASENHNLYSIVVEDQGHGMTRDTVINKWLVPSTDDKLRRQKSPKGRTMQGRKGIGRYASSLLGKDLLLETVAEDGQRTTLYIQWDHFETAQYLDDVDVLVESAPSQLRSGTKLTITGPLIAASEWSYIHFNKLRFELKKLSPPATFATASSDDAFIIRLSIDQNFSNQPTSEVITPFPILELFDYKIEGSISEVGKGTLIYTTQKAKNTVKESIGIDLQTPTGCGSLVFDIRVYDRDAEAINSLIARGLKDEGGNYLGKLETKRLLNESNGVGVYRNGFRLRPLGDADFDWLELNKLRVQNPSLKVGSDQTIGYVQIESEEVSGLIEKSARDGLRDNHAYDQLKYIAKLVLSKLEERRFSYRKKAGLSRPVLKVERELARLFGYGELRKGIEEKLQKGGVSDQTAKDILDVLASEETTKEKIAEDLRQTVAIYQGQATLGKIINVILHEGRRPLSYFKNQIPILNYWHQAYTNLGGDDKLTTCLGIIDGIGTNAGAFVALFSRLDPLASGKRSSKAKVLLVKAIENSAAVFHSQVAERQITITVDGPRDFSLLCWEQDVYSIFTNLFDNSIFWIGQKQGSDRKVFITICTSGDKIDYIDYRDTGPGIEPSLIESQLIFEPEFSTKPGGTGLGLAIAGECAARVGLELKALDAQGGAYFRLSPIN